MPNLLTMSFLNLKQTNPISLATAFFATMHHYYHTLKKTTIDHHDATCPIILLDNDVEVNSTSKHHPDGIQSSQW
jgi:hypothetical protein